MSAKDSAANDLRAVLEAAGVSVRVQGGPAVFEESGKSWVSVSSLEEHEAATVAELLRLGLAAKAAATAEAVVA
ncbi:MULTISPECIES: hypothetical protein [unclassified Kitasatospora]|uniref:hypothetical protein n=1 Tax=unclassified Kitasatospora TaxID=2633591 RepID=UPI00247313A3|nr:hypothetical protein [Kitasatospora sp. MAP12-44]